MLEYGVWLSSAGKNLQRYRTEGLGGTSLEVSGLQAGVAYDFQVRARTSEKWFAYSVERREVTMVPSDFPMPILAPEVAAFVDCTTVRLKLPVLRYCYASTKMALPVKMASLSYLVMYPVVLGALDLSTPFHMATGRGAQ